MQSFDSLLLHCRFYPGLCEPTHGECLTPMPLSFPKTGCKCKGLCMLGVQACKEVIFALFEMWTGGWSGMNVFLVG